MPTTPPEPTAVSTSFCSSCCRPVNEAMSRGSVRSAAAAPAQPGTARPRATASNCALAGPNRCRASASSRAVSLRGVRLTPRSRSLIDRGLRPAASASSSWVSRASVRCFRSRPAKVTGGSATASPLARRRSHPRRAYAAKNNAPIRLIPAQRACPRWHVRAMPGAAQRRKRRRLAPSCGSFCGSACVVLARAVSHGETSQRPEPPARAEQ